MNRSSRVFIFISLVVFPVSYFAFRCIPREATQGTPPINVGKKLCDVAADGAVLLDTARNIFDISNFTAGVHVLVFYSSGCEQCQSRQKALRKVAQKYMKQRVRVVYIRSGKDRFEDFMDERLKKEERLFDEGARLTDAMGIRSFPTEVIVDSEGVIKHISTGQTPSSEKDFVELTGTVIDSLLVSARMTQ